MYSIYWISNFLLIFLIFIFSTSALDKAINFKKSIVTLSNFGIKKNFAQIALVFLLVIEFYIAISLKLMGVTLINLLFITIFFSTVSVVIFINIKNGRKNISCGCGGILENDNLSYSIIIRNIIFILISLCLYNKKLDISNAHLIIIFIVIASIGLINLSIKNLKSFKKNMIKVIGKLQ